MSLHGADETLRDITALVAGRRPKCLLSVDKAAVRDRRKLFVVTHVADAAPGPAAGAAAAVVAADGVLVPAAAGAVAVAAVVVAADDAPVPAVVGAVAVVVAVPQDYQPLDVRSAGGAANPR